MAENQSTPAAAGGSPTDKYEKYVRHHMRDGWTAEKYARMAIYMFLYNKVKGMPKEYGLENNTISWFVRDYIKDHLPELVEKFNLKEIDFLNFNDEPYTDPETGKVFPGGGMQTFLEEIDSYNEHASELCGSDGSMPTNVQMMDLLSSLEKKRSEPFEAIRKSVKVESGESFDSKSGKNREGWLHDERLKKVKEIQEHDRQTRITGFWTGVKGVGIVACAGALVASTMVVFAPASILGAGAMYATSAFGRIAGGILGAVISGAGIKSLGESFSFSIGKLFGQLRKRRKLKNEAGYKGKRGLKAIDRAIEINNAVKKAYGEYEKLIQKVAVGKRKNGTTIYRYIYPTQEQFEAHIYKKFPILRKATEQEAAVGNLFYRARERFHCISGATRRAMDFVRAYETTVVNNNEIPLERQKEYENAFGKKGDVKPTLAETAPGSDKVPDLTMNEYIQTVTHLNNDKDRYINNKEPITYENYQRDAALMLPVIFQRDIFDKPYTGSTYRDNYNLVNSNTIVQEKLKANTTGDKTPYVKNALRFLYTEQNDRVSELKDLGVTMKQQLSLDPEIMSGACESLGLDKTGAEYAEASNICQLIANMNEREMAAMIQTQIDGRITNQRVKNYLTNMLNKKSMGTKASLSSITSQMYINDQVSGTDYFVRISNLIANLKFDPSYNDYVATYNGETRTLDELKAEIFNTNSIPTDIRNSLNAQQLSTLTSNAYEALLEQVRYIERGRMDEIRDQTHDVVRRNEINFDMDTTLDKIEHLMFEQVNTEETLDFYRNSIMKVQPLVARQYLQERLKIKVEEIFMRRIQHHAEYNGEKGLEELSKDLIVLSRVEFIDKAARDRIINSYSARLEETFNYKLTNMELRLLEGNLTENVDLIHRYKNLPYTQGGFKDMFTVKSPRINNILNRLNTLEIGLRYSQYLYGESSVGTPIKDSKSPETRMFLKIFFYNEGRERNNQDSLIKSLMTLPDFFQGLDSGLIVKDEAGVSFVDSSKAVIDKLMTFFNPDDPSNPRVHINSVLGGDSVSYEDAMDQKALLLIYKKKVMGMFKTHLARYIQGHREDAATYITSSGAADLEKIKNIWRPLFEKIDAQMQYLEDKYPDGNEKLKGDSYKNAKTILDQATTRLNMIKFIDSPETSVLDGFERD